MITLSATLQAAQRTLTYVPLWKCVLSRAGETTRGYDNTRIISITHPQSPTSHKAEIVLNNSDRLIYSDGGATSIDFENYQVFISYGMRTGIARADWIGTTGYALDDIVVPTTPNGYQYRCAIAGNSGAAEPTPWPTDLGVRKADSTVTWEMDGNTGDEYCYLAPLRVRVQELHSGRGILRCILRTTGIPDQLAEDKAVRTYTQDAEDTNTVQDLITAIAGATLRSYDAVGYTAYTVAYDSTDGIIETFVPADYFSVSLNESRWDKIQELLDYTGCKMRIGTDGNIHIFNPNTAGAYDYQYVFNVRGDHTFFNKSTRLRFVNPNEEVVRSMPDQGVFTGNATSATSYALAPKTHTTQGRFISNAQCTSIAEAKIEQNELDAERGFATVPMNVGQELWDRVLVTDSRLGDTRNGNIQYLQRNVKIPIGNEGLTFNMAVSFGKVSIQSLMANALASGDGRYTNEQIMSMIDALSENQKILFANHKSLYDYLIPGDDVHFNKLQVHEQMIIPVWEI